MPEAITKEANQLLSMLESVTIARNMMGMPVPAGVPALQAWILRTEHRLNDLEAKASEPA